MPSFETCHEFAETSRLCSLDGLLWLPWFFYRDNGRDHVCLYPVHQPPFDPLIEVTQNFSTLQTAMVSAGRVFALIDERTYEPLQENGQAKVQEGNIRFEHVCFSYDGKHPILDDISFSVNKGETIAFVGHTGSGNRLLSMSSCAFMNSSQESSLG